MRLRGGWAVVGCVLATAGCTSILGDFALETSDATTGDETNGPPLDAREDTPSADSTDDGRRTSGTDALAEDGHAAFDATVDDATADAATADAGRDSASAGDGNSIAEGGSDGSGMVRDATAEAGPDASCPAGLSRCPTGCVALDAAKTCGFCTNDCTSAANVVGSSIGCNAGRCTYTCAPGYADCSDSGVGCAVPLSVAANCGTCGHDCKRGMCAAATCGQYVIAQQPTTGTVAKLATDGTRVVWSDTGVVAIKQIAAVGGAAIALASASSTYGAVSSELAFAGTTVAFAYLGVSVPSVGLATVDVANSGTSFTSGALAVSGISLNAAGTHVFFVDVTGTQGSLNDCPIGRDAGACVGVVGGGRFLGQTAADNAYLFFDLTGANVQQPGLYLDTISTNTANIFTTDTAQSLAVDGTWAYWTVQNGGGATFTIYRTLESAPGTVVQTLASTIASSAFATNGVNVYYWTGSAIASKPVGGGPETVLAPASGFVQIAVGGGLLVWTDAATIWGLVLPGQ